MSTKQLQLRRGTSSAHNSFRGADGEVTVNTTNKSLHVHDAVTDGGFEIARSDLSNIDPSSAVDFNGQKLSNIGAPTASTDATTKQYVDTQITGGAVQFENITGVALSSSTLSDIADASLMLFDTGSIVDVAMTGDATINASGAITIVDDAVTNAKIANPTIAFEDATASEDIALGGTISFIGTADEVEVSLSSGQFQVGLPDDVTVANDLSVGNALSVGNGLTISAGTLSAQGVSATNLVLSGNLTVSGTTTTVNSETVAVADNILLLNSDVTTGTPTQDAGIEIARGDSDNAKLLWDESESKWSVQVGSGTMYALRNKQIDIVRADLEADIIDGTKLADDAVDSEHIVDGSIDNVHLAGSISQDKLAGSIGTDKLSDFSDTLTKTAGNLLVGNATDFNSYSVSGDIDFVQINGTAVEFAIASGVIVDSDISATADIDASKLANLSIDTIKIADTAVTNAKLATGIDGAKLVAGSVDASQLASTALASFDTADLAEGANLYYTDARARSAISLGVASGDGSLAYDNTTGVLTYSGPTQNEVLAHLSTDANLSLSAGGVISLNSAITTEVTGTVSSIANHDTADLAEGTNLYFTEARARNALSLSTSGSGDGALTYNSTTGAFEFTPVTASDVRAHFSAGSNVSYDSATGTISLPATLTLDVTGEVSSIANHDTDALTEGASNLYYTDARVRSALSASGSLQFNSTTGEFSFTERTDAEVNSLADARFTANLASSSTTDLAEGSNLYYTDARSRSAISASKDSGFGDLAYNSTSGALTFTGVSTSQIRSVLVGGTNLTYDSSTGTFNLDSTLTGAITMSGALTASSGVSTTSVSASGAVTAGTSLTVSAGDATISGHNGSTTGLRLGSDLVLATADEINVLSGASAGSASANKALVAGSSNTLIGLSGLGVNGDIASTGEISASEIDISGLFRASSLQGLAVVEANNLQIEDSMIQLNTGSASTDVGFYGVSSGNYVGLAFDTADSEFQFFRGTTNVSNNTMPTFSGANVRLNALVAEGAVNVEGALVAESDVAVQGTLTSEGKRVLATDSTTSTAYSVTATDHVVTVNASASSTVTLPAAASSTGRELIILNGSSNDVTITDSNGTGADIRGDYGASGDIFLSAGGASRLVCNGTLWYKV